MQSKSDIWDTSYSHEIKFTIFLKNTLEKYTFGFGVFQGLIFLAKRFSKFDVNVEWLANADDAKASKFIFMLDYGSYQTETLFGVKMAVWQVSLVVRQTIGIIFLKGPSIMIYNNSVFSDEDWRG